MSPAERIAQRIRRDGPVPFDWFVECALYDPDGGFFARGRGRVAVAATSLPVPRSVRCSARS
ncbi:MAG: hypothetical protein M5T61_07845 [Acidimicrobiia bacterium]|nr:hypothetical protein [Acidimicrobiia bacterium]